MTSYGNGASCFMQKARQEVRPRNELMRSNCPVVVASFLRLFECGGLRSRLQLVPAGDISNDGKCNVVAGCSSRPLFCPCSKTGALSENVDHR